MSAAHRRAVAKKPPLAKASTIGPASSAAAAPVRAAFMLDARRRPVLAQRRARP